MNQYIEKHKGELQQTIEFFTKDIAAIRTGRANPAMLDGVMVFAYGAKMPLAQVGNINVIDARCLIVVPWDKNILKEVEKAITEAELGVNPVNEGDKIRLTIPQPTEEDRRERVKKLNEKLEHAKVSVRQMRDKIKEAIELAEGNKEIAEDDKFRFLKEMEEEIKKYSGQLEEMTEKKEQEIMTI